MTDDIIKKVREALIEIRDGVPDSSDGDHYDGWAEIYRLVARDALKALSILENIPTGVDRATALAELSCLANRLRGDWSETGGQALNEEQEK